MLIAWKLDKLKDYRWKGQQVQIKMNYDLVYYKPDSNLSVIDRIESDKFITFVSVLTVSQNLVSCYLECLDDLESFIVKMTTSYSEIRENYFLVYTYRIGHGLN